MFVFRKRTARTSSSQDLKLLQEEEVLRPSMGFAAPNSTHTSGDKENLNGKVWTVMSTGAWGRLLDDQTKRPPGPSREEGPTVSSCDHLS